MSHTRHSYLSNYIIFQGSSNDMNKLAIFSSNEDSMTYKEVLKRVTMEKDLGFKNGNFLK